MTKPLAIALGMGLLAGTLVGVGCRSFAIKQHGDYYYEVSGCGVTINRYFGTNTVVVIPSSIDEMPVTRIADGAFYCTFLASVTIPDSVTNIGHGAFGECGSLKAVTMPDSVTLIEPLAFQDCASLTNLMLSSNLATIQNSAFVLCWNLERLYFKGNAPCLGGTNVFDGCPANLTIYHLPNTTGWGTNFGGRPTAVWE